MTCPRCFVRLSLLLLVALPFGCGRRRVEEAPSVPPEVEGPIGVRIAAVEKILEAKGYTLPSVVKGLARDLKELRADFRGDAAALDTVIRRLEDWHARSNARKTDTDADRAEVRRILVDLKTLLKTQADDNAPETP